ncbi:PRC-barrel domain-containing protein [Pelagibacterium xiamenense]|uniref:PRC-barrel domain-containing protein n=1 Tax=Pelagibacterium xiamenense TaxID=2901140 RepID=UPI001E568E93|nr:PRC-barrel domain-containing protein [Pelagibacterium xiamenense]MCD7060177.1 PRC-barrel domain-containing protein [Pelagibacterium xiamenense]
MYSKLLASTALALAMAGSTFAQDAVAPAPADPAVQPPAGGAEMPAETPQEPLVEAQDAGINADGWLATEIIGAEIFTAAAEDAEVIGEVNDFVLGQNGEIAAVVVGVGGFLGIGQKNVAINWSDLQLGTDPNGEQRLISSMTREQLENAQEFNREEWLASEQGGNAAAPAGGDVMAPAPEGGDAMAPAPEGGDVMAPEGGDAMAPEGGDAMAPEGDDAMSPEVEVEGEIVQQ